MLLLIDQDGVLADYERGFLNIWRKRHPNAFYVPYEGRSTFLVRDQYPEHLLPEVYKVNTEPGFFRNLKPIPGAIEGMHALLDAGHDVRICTSPLTQFENCVLEKHLWVEEHLGREFVKRVILTKRKDVVRGSLLLDDNPDVTCDMEPEWTHVRYAAPYNVGRAPRADWSTFPAFVEEFAAASPEARKAMWQTSRPAAA